MDFVLFAFHIFFSLGTNTLFALLHYSDVGIIQNRCVRCIRQMSNGTQSSLLISPFTFCITASGWQVFLEGGGGIFYGWKGHGSFPTMYRDEACIYLSTNDPQAACLFFAFNYVTTLASLLNVNSNISK